MQIIDSLYIHFPFCKHLCNYCDFYKYKLENQKQISDFEKKMIKNLEDHEKLLSDNSCKIERLDSLYIGGGTPSLWGKNGSHFVKKYIKEKYGFQDKIEFTLEVDPDNWTFDTLQSWFDIGVNRVSVGAQSYDPYFLKMADRSHSIEDIDKLLEFLKNKNVNFSVDLLLGLPNKEKIKRDVVGEIERLASFNPSHFSVYILKTRSNYSYKDYLPKDEVIEKEYLDICKKLDGLCYKQYEVSNFAKDDKKSKHNLKYWKARSVAALGATATGFINLKNKALRYQYKSSGSGFHLENLNESQLELETLYMNLRSSMGIDKGLFDSEDKQKVLKKWNNLDYLIFAERNIVLNSKGYLVLDSLMDDLFNHNII
ncbi:MAG: radical SAM protein [Bacteriovoracaceae bacterium]|jgi:oxygen-independent coproporphyrinogen-3 oxidase|nr:radical SAM protein [Bacteriovoracaceae bacterium]